MKVTGLPSERIVKLGPKENYWSMGVPGPGGPSSEILYDRGPDHGPEGEFETTERLVMPAKLEDRYLEIWNLVFMQDELSAVRSKEDFDIVGPLPKRNIDTGMGLERVAYLLQGVDNMYEIDVMYPVIERAEELTGRRYGADHDDDVRIRVVADHVRSSLMLIADGVTPGNEGRGYVLRRLLRRAVRSMRLLGYDDPALPELLPVSRDKMGETYSELHRDWERISHVAYAEEDAFRQTLQVRDHDLRPGGRAGEAVRRDHSRRRPRVRAARHLRLPDRPDPGDGRRAGARGRRGRLPRPDEPAAAARQGGRPRQEGRPRQHRGVPPGGRRPRSRGRLHRLPRGGQRGRRPRASSATARSCRAPARATRWSWSSTARRSTPRAAGSSPTRA